MEELEHLEAELAEFEHLTGQPLTILGLDGIFDFRQARRLFTPQRASHKKIGACAAIFSEHCIEHCRHRQSRLCREAAGPFVSECPFGIRQLVFPLREQLVHYGMLFLGAWRSEAGSGMELPEPFRSEYAKLPPANPAEEAALLLLGELCADGVLHRLRARGLLADTPDFRSARIRDFLQSRLAGRVGLPDLAQELELSSSHTSVLVKQLFGCSFTTLLQRMRVEAAAHYLAGTELRLHRIAELCGFSSEFHLSRVFKQQTGLAPSVWRLNSRTPPQMKCRRKTD